MTAKAIADAAARPTAPDDAPVDAPTPDAAPRPDAAAVVTHDEAPARGSRWPGRRGLDLAAAVVYLLGAIWVTARGWRDVDGRLLGSRPDDQGFNEWMLAYAARAVTHLENPFFTTLQNAPDGVNLMTNVGIQLVGILLTPVTLVGGASLSYLVLITANLVGTALAWYRVLSRHVVRSRAAAFLGGLACAFAPAMISSSNGHPHITAQWLVPFIVWRVVRLAQPDAQSDPRHGTGHDPRRDARPRRAQVRDGLVLGGLIAAQFFVGLEILFLTALGCAMALVGYALQRPRATLRLMPSALVTLGVAGALVAVVAAYPLWMQFAGPQHRIGHPGDPNTGALSLGSFVAYATESIGGSPTSAQGLAPNTTEEMTFFGWPLLVLAAGIVVWLRRELVVRILAGTAAVAGILTIGTTLAWGTRRTDIPAPFALFAHLPIFDAMVVARFGLITTAALGVLLALAADRLLALAPKAEAAGVPLRLIAGTVAVAALLPVLPTPLPAQGRSAESKVPHFVTSGHWRDHVADGRTLVPVPVHNMRSIYWGAAALAGFAVPQGYFLGPVSATDRTGRWGTDPRPTAALLTAVADGKRGTEVSAADRTQAVEDVRHWRADAVALPAHPRETELRAVLDACFGPGRRVDDVWLWDVRPLTR